MSKQDRNALIREIFFLLIELPKQKRLAKLHELCRQRPLVAEIRTDILELLEHDEGTQTTLKAPENPDQSDELFDTKTDKVFGGYQIVSKLGAGAMGDVFLGKDLSLNRHVALKFMSLQTEERKARFKREGQAIAALSAHPNVCTIYHSLEVESQPILVMEYIEGVTLEEKIGAGPISLNECTDIIIQIGRGLSHAHQNGIVHRDIKPGNIMISKSGVPKILDFGIAKLQESSFTRVGTLLGTVAYMSPEQLNGETVDQRTDIWSLGLMLYELIVLEHPYRKDTYEATIAAIYSTDIEETIKNTLIEKHDCLNKVITQALQKERNKRYQTVHDFINDLLSITSSGALQDKGKKFSTKRILSFHAVDNVTPSESPKYRLLFGSRKSWYLTLLAGVMLMFLMIFSYKTTSYPIESIVVSGTVQGMGGQPIVGAHITIDGHNFGSFSKSNGHFLSELEVTSLERPITFRVSHEGYCSYSEDVIIKNKEASLAAKLDKLTAKNGEGCE